MSLTTIYIIAIGLIGIYGLFLLTSIIAGLRQFRQGARLLGSVLVAAPIMWSILPPFLNEGATDRKTDAIRQLQLIPDQLPMSGQSVLIVDLTGTDTLESPCRWLCKAMLTFQGPDEVFVTSMDGFDWDALDEDYLRRVRYSADILKAEREGEIADRVRHQKVTLSPIENWPDPDIVVIIDPTGFIVQRQPALTGLDGQTEKVPLGPTEWLSDTTLVYTGWPKPADLSSPDIRMVGAALRVSSGFLWFASAEIRHVQAREAQEHAWCRLLKAASSSAETECPG